MKRRAGQKKPQPLCVCRGHVKKQWAKPFHVTRDWRTCDPARCTSVALRAAGGICRSSALASEGNRLWQYQSSAAIDDMLRRNAGTCYLSSAWKAPCMHPNDCYSTLNRSRSHLAVRGRRKGITQRQAHQTSAASNHPTCQQEGITTKEERIPQARGGRTDPGVLFLLAGGTAWSLWGKREAERDLHTDALLSLCRYRVC